MRIAQVEDSFFLNEKVVLNGIVVMAGTLSRILVRDRLGDAVRLQLPDGREFRTELLKVDVQEAFSGQMQIMVSIEPLPQLEEIPKGTIISSLS